VLALASTAPSTGYWAKPTGARVEGDRLVVSLDVAPPDGMAGQALTDPFVVLAVDRTDLPPIAGVDVVDATP